MRLHPAIQANLESANIISPSLFHNTYGDPLAEHAYSAERDQLLLRKMHGLQVLFVFHLLKRLMNPNNFLQFYFLILHGLTPLFAHTYTVEWRSPLFGRYAESRGAGDGQNQNLHWIKSSVKQ